MAFALETWREAHRAAFVQLHCDPEVMADLGGPYELDASHQKFDRYRDAWAAHGISRWAVADADGAFLGYAGVMLAGDAAHPLGSHYEIGWRFRRDIWGQGLASRSARHALQHAWATLSTDEILAYTAADNHRSQAVMARLGLARDAARDFTARYDIGDWHGLVWRAERPPLA